MRNFFWGGGGLIFFFFGAEIPTKEKLCLELTALTLLDSFGTIQSYMLLGVVMKHRSLAQDVVAPWRQASLLNRALCRSTNIIPKEGRMNMVYQPHLGPRSLLDLSFFPTEGGQIPHGYEIHEPVRRQDVKSPCLRMAMWDKHREARAHKFLMLT